VGKRIFSTVALWLLLLAALWCFGTNGAIAAIVIVSVLTLREFYRLMAAAGNEPFAKLGMLFGALITLAPWTQARFGLPAHPLLAMATVVFAIRVLSERAPDKRVVTPVAMDTVLPQGRLILCLWVVAVAKFCDVGALLTGLAIGRHPMAPQISPKKTWEGAAGGVAVAAGIGALVAWLGRSYLPAAMSPGYAALLAVPLAAIAIVSDLLESVLKRRAVLKDSGGAVPGIGGIFDLSDSLILAAPVGYFLLGLP